MLFSLSFSDIAVKMFCIIGRGCNSYFEKAHVVKELDEMHSNEAPPQAPTTGPALLLQLGRLIVHRRSPTAGPRAHHDRLLQAKLLAVQAQPSTSKQILIQPLESEDLQPQLEVQLSDHVHSLWGKQIPICIDVLLAPNCQECYSRATRVDDELAFEKAACHDNRCLLLERWTMSVFLKKNNETQAFISSQWLLNAVRSQLHFSQLSAWLSRLKDTIPVPDQLDPNERRRKLSREQCNIKKLEANCDEEDLPKPQNHDEPKLPIKKLNIVYSIKVPGISYKMADFSRTPIDHTFPITDIGNNVYLKVVLQTLPRRADIPTVKCCCQIPKRRASKEMTPLSDELALRLNDLTLGPSERQCFNNDLFRINPNNGVARKLSMFGTNEYNKQDRQANGEKKCDKKKCDKNGVDTNYLVDDRMLTPCSENGKHRCSCDDESDNGNNRRLNLRPETKKLDERRLKEIAKYKRRLRKESKLRKLRESGTSESATSEGDYGPCKKETHTSIPILQASRFDRFRAIGCYRNQTYLTLPASRIETKSPFVETVTVIPTEYRSKSTSVGTQTDEPICSCGSVLTLKCEECNRGMVRSQANYDLASLNLKVRKAEDLNEGKVNKKLKCDITNNKTCDKIIDNNIDDKVSLDAPAVSGIRKCPDDDVEQRNIIKRPKLRRIFPIVEKLDKVVNDRLKNEDFLNDVKDEKHKNGDISSDFEDDKDVVKVDFDFKVEGDKNVDTEVPSATEVDKFRWRFVSAASMVFHTKTGLPLTSSPAPLKRGNNCFDYDDSINGISGIKSALFQPIPSSITLPPSPAVTSPDPEPDTTPVRSRRGPSAGLLGSFEESALKGRLEPVATVHGFTAEIGASGAFCPPHKKLPVTVFFYAPGGTNAPYMGHINLGTNGYRVSKSGTIQVSLFNPHGTLVKMFVVLYDLTTMPNSAKTFLRQRTLHMPVGMKEPPNSSSSYKWLRYLIHLRFLTSKTGKLYLHTDIRIIVSRKSDLDTATAHSAILEPKTGNNNNDKSSEIQNGVSYELRSFTYGPDNPKYSPR